MNFIHNFIARSLACLCVSFTKRGEETRVEESLTTKRVLTCHQEHIWKWHKGYLLSCSRVHEHALMLYSSPISCPLSASSQKLDKFNRFYRNFHSWNFSLLIFLGLSRKLLLSETILKQSATAFARSSHTQQRGEERVETHCWDWFIVDSSSARNVIFHWLKTSDFNHLIIFCVFLLFSAQQCIILHCLLPALSRRMWGEKGRRESDVVYHAALEGLTCALS